jgi:nicotinate-nucleotide pyrophosphorylase
MNWIDEGALYSQIGLFLREDLGRGDITTQSIIVRALVLWRARTWSSRDSKLPRKFF